MKRMTLAWLFFLGMCLRAQNVVENSDFSVMTGKNKGAMLWNVTYSGDKNPVNYIREGDKGYYQFSTDKPTSPCIRQYGLVLVPGEQYRIAFDLSAEQLSYAKFWVVVVTNGWKMDAGLKLGKGTLTTDGIQHYEETLTVPPSLNDNYSIAFYMNDATGKCSLYNLTLKPLTEKGRLGSHSNLKLTRISMAILAVDRMGIPREQNQLSIALSYVSGVQPTLQATIDGKPLPEQTFKNGLANLDISAYKEGTHHLVLKAMQGEQLLSQREEDFAFAAPLPSFHHTRKGFTEELLNTTIAGKRQFEFVAPTDGWFFIRVETTPGKIVAALLDDAVQLYPQGSYRNETMRNLTQGLHKITFQEEISGTLQVRAVPMTFKYAGVTTQVSFPSMPPYDWDWHKKHVVGRSANFGPNGINKYCLEESKLFGVTYGLRYKVNRTQPSSPEQAELTLEKFNSCPGILDKDSYYVGMDEFEWNDFGALLNFADIANRVKNVHNKYIIHWLASQEGPSIFGLHHYIIEQFLNMGGGKGLLAFEFYFSTRPSEAETTKMITNAFHSVVDGLEEFFPGTPGKTLLCFANMNHPTYISCAIHPQVNFKYFMDLEMYLLANSPAGRKIGGVGYWGCHYADADVNLWTQELFRHYCCDGNTEMLSKQYGYTYILPHLANGDFHDGLNGYTVQGEVTTDRLLNFGKASMNLWGGHQQDADTVAVLSPNASLSTTAVQLDPKSTYKLEYVTADYEDVKQKLVNPKPIPISLHLDNAEILAQFDQIDNLQKLRNTSSRIHYFVTHFRPTASTMPMRFTCNSQDGRKCTLNFIKIEPLFEKQ